MKTRHFEANAIGRDFVVGDLHGCRAMLDSLLVKISFDATKDRLFCVGDLIDRGPDSAGCLALLDEPWFFSVMGNHEEIMMWAANDPAFNWPWWIQNGGTWALTLTAPELRAYADEVSVLPLTITVGSGDDRFNVIHAEFFGSNADLDAGEFTDAQQLALLWGRDIIEGKVVGGFHRGLSPTYCGHTILENIHQIRSQIYIDTGAHKAEFWGKDAIHAMTIIEPRTGVVWRSEFDEDAEC